MTGPHDAVEAIRQLKARYFRLLDTKQWDQWRNVFADDIDIRTDLAAPVPGQSVPALEFRGSPEGFVADVRSRIEHALTIHHGHMPEIELIDADNATGIWAMEDVVEFAGGLRLHGYGHYHESYIRTAAGWRIAKLHLTRLKVTDNRAKD